jgi:hypothetical protein
VNAQDKAFWDRYDAATPKVRLLNGQKHVRERTSADCEVLACGCAHDGRRWLQMCQADFHAWDLEHQSAARARAKETK